MGQRFRAFVLGDDGTVNQLFCRIMEHRSYRRPFASEVELVQAKVAPRDPELSAWIVAGLRKMEPGGGEA